MSYFVYILLCGDRRFYIGYTSNIRQRMKSHVGGRVLSTRHRKVLRLLHYEYFTDRKDAKAREIYLKSGAGHEQIRKFLRNALSEYGHT